MIRVIGFSTLFDKPRGRAGIVDFKDEDCFDSEVPPTEEWLREYAKRRGYKSDGARCDPVYLYLS